MIKVRVNNRSQQADRSSINAIAAAQAWAGETGRIESGVWGWAPSRKEFVERFPVVTLESKMGLTPNRHGHIMYGLKNPLRSLPSTSVQPQLVNAPARIQDFAACHSAQCSGSFGLSGAFLDEQAAAKNQAGWDRYCKKGLDRKERSRNFDLAKAGREGDRTVSAALRQEKRMLLLDEDELAAVESLLYPGAAKAAKALKAAEKKLKAARALLQMAEAKEVAASPEKPERKHRKRGRRPSRKPGHKSTAQGKNTAARRGSAPARLSACC